MANLRRAQVIVNRQLFEQFEQVVNQLPSDIRFDRSKSYDLRISRRVPGACRTSPPRSLR